MQHLKRMINFYHKEHSEKSIAIFSSIDIASPMARPTIKSTKPAKRKRACQAKISTNKRTKRIWACQLLQQFLIFSRCWPKRVVSEHFNFLDLSHSCTSMCVCTRLSYWYILYKNVGKISAWVPNSPSCPRRPGRPELEYRPTGHVS